MANIKFRIRKSTKEFSSIYIRLMVGREIDIEKKTGFFINPSNWSDSKKMPKQNIATNKTLYNDLKKLETYVLDELNKASATSTLINNNWLEVQINNCFNRVDESDNTFLVNHIQTYIDNASTKKIRGNTIGLSENRIKGLTTFKNTMLDYEKYIKKEIHFSEISKSFVDSFIDYLLNDVEIKPKEIKRKYTINYTGKILDNLKTICLDASKNGVEINPYCHKIQSFKEKDSDRFFDTLSFDELDQIKRLDLKTEHLNNVRKWVLIGCEIGQRISDLMKLTKNDLKYNDEFDFHYFNITQKKTNKLVTIPIGKQYIIDIIKNEMPYPISEQKFNTYIKDVCEKAEINELTEGKLFDKETKRKKSGKYPKYKLISSHCLRRSFATNYYNKIDTPHLIEITGHSTESMFLTYINQKRDKMDNARLFLEQYSKVHDKRKSNMKVIKKAN